MQDSCLSFMLKVCESCSEGWVLHKDWKPLVPGFVTVLVLCRSCYQHIVGKKAAWAISNWGQVTCKYWMSNSCSPGLSVWDLKVSIQCMLFNIEIKPSSIGEYIGWVHKGINVVLKYNLPADFFTSSHWETAYTHTYIRIYIHTHIYIHSVTWW